MTAHSTSNIKIKQQPKRILNAHRSFTYSLSYTSNDDFRNNNFSVHIIMSSSAAARKRKNKSSKKSATGDEGGGEELMDLIAGHGDPTDFFKAATTKGAAKSKGKAKETKETFYRKKKNAHDSDSEEEEEDNNNNNTSAARAAKKSAAAASAGGVTGGIKTGPLIVLMILFGSAVLPAVLYMGDFVSKTAKQNNWMGSIGYRLGLSAVPRKRVVSFYEKHAPDKIDDVPAILAKHYGEYPKLLKKLERKYQDYGYFIGWEQDEQAIKTVQESVQNLRKLWLDEVWNRYAPRFLRTAGNNIRRNLTTLYKRASKIWKKKIWPFIEPYIGIPDERTAAKQRRKDAADAKQRQREKARATSSSGTRKKNTDFREEGEEETTEH